MGGVWVSDTTTILIESEIATVMQTVLDFPMATDQMGQPGFTGLRWQQTGNAVGDFFAAGSIRENRFTLHSKDLSCMGKIDLFGFNCPADDATAFDASVALVMVPFLPGKKAMGEASCELCLTTRAGSS